MVELICFVIEFLHCLSFQNCFSQMILPNLVYKTKDVYVLLKKFQCALTIASFDMWMSKNAYDIFALVINFLDENWQPKKVTIDDAPPSFFMDSTISLKVKTMEGKGVGVCFLARSTLGVERRARTLGCGLGRLISKSITYTDLHKPNNKLVNA